MPNVDTANTFYLVLTLFADAVVLFALGFALAALVSKRAREVATRMAAGIAPHANLLGFVVALVVTTGSLYYSEHAGFIPCQLCWFQRILMYPLVIVLGVAALRKDRRAWMTVLPFVVIGAGVSTYHWLVERVPAFAESSSCSLEAPCTAPWFEKLGFVTLAWMALSGFLLIGTLMVCQIVGNRVDAGDSPPDATAQDAQDEFEEETVTS
jgi:disulfide bond formation protein DsbB